MIIWVKAKKLNPFEECVVADLIKETGCDRLIVEKIVRMTLHKILPYCETYYKDTKFDFHKIDFEKFNELYILYYKEVKLWLLNYKNVPQYAECPIVWYGVYLAALNSLIEELYFYYVYHGNNKINYGDINNYIRNQIKIYFG